MAILTLILFFVVFLVIALRSPRYAMFAMFFLAPWHGLDIDIGVRITGYRLVVAALVIAIGLRMSLGKNRYRFVKSHRWLWLFVLYALVNCIIQISLLPQTGLFSGGALRSGLLRPVAQIFMFGLTLAPLFLVPLSVRKTSDIISLGKTYLWSVTILAVLGWLQLGLWYGIGFNPFPIGLVNSFLGGSINHVLREGVDFVGYVSVYRMNSFGGEPKGLATGFAVGLLLLQAGGDSVLLWRRKTILLWGFLMASLLLTWSTSGVFLWLIGTVVLMLLGAGGVVVKKYNRRILLTSSVVVLAIMAITSLLYIKDPGNVFHTLIERRFIGRNPIEDFDEVVLLFLKDQPGYLIFGVGLGNIHLYAEHYIDPLYRFMFGNIFVAKSGYLRIVSELGLVGFLLFVFSVWQMASLVRNKAHANSFFYKKSNLGNMLSTIGIVLFVGGMARGYIWPQMFLALGACMAYLPLSSLNITPPEFFYSRLSSELPTRLLSECES